MKTIFALLIASSLAASAADRALHQVNLSNDFATVKYFIVVAQDGTNILRTPISNVAASNAFWQSTNAIQRQVTGKAEKTNGVQIISSAWGGYYGLKIHNISNELAGIGFFDYTGAEAFQLRSGTNGGIFDFFDVTNNRTVFRYNGVLNTFTFYGAVILPQATADMVGVIGPNNELTNSASVTRAGLEALYANAITNSPFGQIVSNDDTNTLSSVAFYRWTNAATFTLTNKVASANGTNLIPIVDGWYEVELELYGALVNASTLVTNAVFTNGIVCPVATGTFMADSPGGLGYNGMGGTASAIVYLPAGISVDMRTASISSSDVFTATRRRLSIKLLR